MHNKPYMAEVVGGGVYDREKILDASALDTLILIVPNLETESLSISVCDEEKGL